jgi:hypothetical protein
MKDFKVSVPTPETRQIVIAALLRLDIYFRDTPNAYDLPSGCKYLYVYKDGSITHGSDRYYFMNHPSPEVKLPWS